MASTANPPDRNRPLPGLGEEGPLLGRVGDIFQRKERPIYYNFFTGEHKLMIGEESPTEAITGTAVIGQGGIILLMALIWVGVFLHPPLSLFSAHPLLNSSGILLLTESILVLQPTYTAAQKRQGTIVHFVVNIFAVDALIAAFVIIEYNKFAHKAIHFNSVHGKLGLTTYILLSIQSVIGFTQYFVPQLYGGVENAKAIYKWHRMSGYVTLIMMLATACAATQTYTGMNTLDIKLWAVLVSSVLILTGVLPRIKKHKFGLTPNPSGAFAQ